LFSVGQTADPNRRYGSRTELFEQVRRWLSLFVQYGHDVPRAGKSERRAYGFIDTRHGCALYMRQRE
jgi:hypothetical protein